MTTTDFRELNVAELEQVAGGMDPNYQYCANGPAGEGVYPWSTNCNYTNADFVRDIIRNGGGGKGGKGGAGPVPA